MAGAKCVFLFIWIDMAELPSVGVVAVRLAITEAGD